MGIDVEVAGPRCRSDTGLNLDAVAGLGRGERSGAQVADGAAGFTPDLLPRTLLERPFSVAEGFTDDEKLALDGRAQPVDPDPSWMGTSVGRWDGDALVIEAIGFNDKTEVHGFMHTEALRVVERFQKLENGNLQYDVTVEDPNVWVKPWTIPSRTFALRPELEFVSEFVCESTVDYQRLFQR